MAGATADAMAAVSWKCRPAASSRLGCRCPLAEVSQRPPVVAQLGNRRVRFHRHRVRAFQPLAFLPGYMRGMCFVGNHAIIGLSRPRHEKTFSGLALDDRLKAEGVEPRCGLAVIDLKTGDQVNWVQIEGLVSELYDVVSLPGRHTPDGPRFANDDVSRLLTIGPAGEL